MADTVKVPGAKKPLPKWAVIAGLGAVAAAAFLYYRNKSSSTATTAATTTDQYPPDGTTGDPSDPYSTDPATGQTYGDEAVGAGTFGAFSSTGSDQGIIGYDANGNPVYAPGYGPGSTGGTTGGPPFSTNDAWSNWVVLQLQTDNPNVNSADLLAALGAYLEGQAVTAAQKTLIMEARAVGGDPPVAGANNYPPNLRTGGTSGSDVKVPDVVGKTVNQAQAALKTAKLTYNTDTAADKPGDERIVTAQNPAAGASVPQGTHVGLTWKSEKTVKVPPVTGKTVNQAESDLKSAGLTYNTNEAADKKGFERKVTASNPKAGTGVPAGSKVGLTWHYVKS